MVIPRPEFIPSRRPCAVPAPAGVVLLVLLLGGLGAALGDPVGAQVPETGRAGSLPPGVEATVDVRPRRVRIGDRILLTLRVRVPTDRTLVVEELAEAPGVQVMDVRDRSSVAVGAGAAAPVREVVWTLEAWEPGELAAGPLRIWIDDGAWELTVPEVEILDAPLRRMAAAGREAPGPRRDREPPVLPDGRPPPLGGGDAAVIPGGSPAGPGLVATRPGGPGGAGILLPGGGLVTGLFGRPGVPGAFPGAGSLTTGAVGASDGWRAGIPGGWAEQARQDPYWEELVPRVEQWASVVRDPSGLVELSAGVSPATVYVGQQVTFLAAAGFRPEAGYRMTRDPEYFAPVPRDVWQVDVARFGAGYVGASGGELQDVRPFVQAFFPLRPGTLTIPPAAVGYSLGGAGRFGPLDTLRTEPVAVRVLPVPADQAPPGWDGAVGRWTVGVTLDGAALTPGEAGVLTVTVRGAGNVDGLPAPRPTNLRGVVLRPLGERAVVEVVDGVVGGVKVFQWLVTVTEPGQLSLGPFLLTYFDPWAGAFEVAATREVLLEAIGQDPAPEDPLDR